MQSNEECAKRLSTGPPLMGRLRCEAQGDGRQQEGLPNPRGATRAPDDLKTGKVKAIPCDDVLTHSRDKRAARRSQLES